MKRRTPVKRSAATLIAAAIASLCLGIALASLHLVLSPVPLGQSDDAVSGTISCQFGETEPGTRWDNRARPMFKGVPGSYAFSEGEINALLSRHFQLSDASLLPAGVTLGVVPNVRFLPSGLVRVTIVVQIPSYGGMRRMIYQVRGRVDKDGFVPVMGWLGQCPVPFFNNVLISSLGVLLQADRDASAFWEVRRRMSFEMDNGYLIVDVHPES